MNDRHRSDARSPLVSDDDAPEVPTAPAVDGPFVEVAPTAWVRASDVLAVWTPADPDPHGPRDTALAVGAEGGAPLWWSSPYPTEQLRTALRLAEHHEDFRRLEAFARLLRLYAARGR